MKKLLSIILTALLLTNLIGVNYIHAEEGETLSEPPVENVEEETTTEEEVKEEIVVEEETKEEEALTPEEEKQEETKEEETPFTEEETPTSEEEKQEEIIEEENIEEETALLEEGPLGAIDDDASDRVRFNIGTYTYNGHHQSPTISIKSEHWYNHFDSDPIYTYYDAEGIEIKECIEAGAYTVKATAIIRNLTNQIVGTANVETKFEILPIDIYLNWDENILTYDGTDRYYDMLPTLSTDVVNFDAVIEEVEITKTISESEYVTIDEPIDSGLYNIYITPTEATKNYKIADDAILSNDRIISPATLSLTWAVDDIVYYNGESYEDDFRPILEGVVEGEDVSLEYTINGLDKNIVEPDKYLIDVTEIKGEDIINYSFEPVQKTFVIAKNQLYIVWPETSSYTYDDDYDYYDNFMPIMVFDSFDYDATDLVTAIVYDDESGKDVKYVHDVGSYTTRITLNSYAGGNPDYYEIVNADSKQFEVTPCNLYFSWDNLTYTYGDLDNFYYDFLPHIYTDESLADWSEFDNSDGIIEFSVNGESSIDTISDAGSYTIEATLVNNDPNYNIPATRQETIIGFIPVTVNNETSHTYTVSPCVLYAKWNMKTSTQYDDTFSYGDKDNFYDYFLPTIHTDYNATEENEIDNYDIVWRAIYKGDVQIDSEARDLHDVGTYHTYVAVMPEYENNYVFAENTLLRPNVLDHEFTINVCKLYTRWNTGTLTYNGENQYDSIVPTLYTDTSRQQEFTKEGVVRILVNEEEIDNVVDAGTYNVRIELVDQSGNYEIPDKRGTSSYSPTNEKSYSYTINPKNIWVNWIAAVGVTYDGTSHREYAIPDVYSNEGLSIKEDNSMIDIVVNSATYFDGEPIENYDSMIEAGTYSISAKVKDEYENNYNIINILKTWDYTISRARLQLTWPEIDEVTYDEKDHYNEFIPELSGVIGDEKITLETYFDDLSTEEEEMYMKVVNAGNYLASTMIIATKNYVGPTNPTKEFTINKRIISAYSDDESSIIYKTYDPHGIKITSDEVKLYYEGADEKYYQIGDVYDPSEIRLGDAILFFTVDPISPEGNIYALNAGVYGIELFLDENSDLARNNEFEKDDNILIVYVKQKDVYFAGVSSDSEIKWGTEEEPYSVTWRDSAAKYQGYELLPPLLNFEDKDGNDVTLCPNVDYTYKVDGTLLNAGTYNVGISGFDIGNSNYNIVDQDKVDFKLTINPKEASFRWTDLDIYYGENNLAPKYEMLGLTPNDEEKVGLNITYDGQYVVPQPEIGVHEAKVNIENGFIYLYTGEKCENYVFADGAHEFIIRYSIVGDDLEHNTEDGVNISSFVENNSVQLESLSLKCPSGTDLKDILSANENTELAYALHYMLFEDPYGLANVYLVAKDVDPSTINFIDDNVSEENSVFFDLTLNIDTYYHAGAGSHVVFNVTETGNYFVEVTFKINQEQANKIGYASNKDFYVVNNHGGSAFPIKLDAPSYDETTGLYTFTFKTNKFCTFYLYSTKKPGGGGGSNHKHSVPNTTTTLEFEANSIVDVKACYKKEEDYDLEEEF